jgi:hypothetical protein
MVRPKKHIFISLKSLGTNCCHPFDHLIYIYRTFQHVATIEVLNIIFGADSHVKTRNHNSGLKAKGTTYIKTLGLPQW